MGEAGFFIVVLAGEADLIVADFFGGDDLAAISRVGGLPFERCIGRAGEDLLRPAQVIVDDEVQRVGAGRAVGLLDAPDARVNQMGDIAIEWVGFDHLGHRQWLAQDGLECAVLRVDFRDGGALFGRWCGGLRAVAEARAANGRRISIGK